MLAFPGLRAHVQQRQSTCFFCYSRFENSYEAERHERSAHLRPKCSLSWSCATLASNHGAAFRAIANLSSKDSSSKPILLSLASPMDICVYCGELFLDDAFLDWEKRQSHLVKWHKFGDCMQEDKYEDLDSFRQHNHACETSE